MSDAEGLRVGRTQQDDGRPVAARSAPGLILGAAFLAMALGTWGTWPDVMVDFGTELYLPWRLSEGDVLGRDLLPGGTGCLSPIVNAILFRVFGTGLRTLVLANLAVLALVTWLGFAILRDLFDTGAATLASLFLLLVLAFGQFTTLGNYNFVAPYTHGATHALLLALLAAWLRRRHAATGRALPLAAAATCVGATLLTKPEFFTAAAAAAAVELLLLLRATPGGPARLRLLLLSTLPALLPLALTYAALAAVGGREAALQGTLLPWLVMATPFLLGAPYYARVLGLDQAATNLGTILASTAVWGALLGGAALLDVRAGPRGRGWWPAVLAALAVAGVGGLWMQLDPRGLAAGAPAVLPVAMLVGGLPVVLAAWRRGVAGDGRDRLAAGLVVLAGLLLAKLGLRPRFYHYGFIMAAPATLLALGWLSSALPRLVRARGGRGAIVHAAGGAAVATLAWLFLSITFSNIGRKDVIVGTGPDAFLADRRGEVVAGMAAKLAADLPPGATLAVIPEGIVLNYLVRRPAPGPYLSYLPNAVAWRGEAAMLASLRARPPDYVVLASRDSSEYGPRTFGVDYAQETWRWIEGAYEPLGGIGPSPFQPGPYFGMRLLRRRPQTTPAPR